MTKDEEFELLLLRQVYEYARGVIRYNGIDKDKVNLYFDKLDSAINEVMMFKSGNYDSTS